MLYKQITDHCFNKAAGKNGISGKTYSHALKKAKEAMVDLKKRNLRFFEVVNEKKDLKEIDSLAKKIRKSYKHVIISGIGGSSLCGKALANLECINKSPHLIFLDNVDPHTIDCLLDSINLEKTFFLTISKSGGTLETLTQFLACLDFVNKKLGKKAVKKQFAVITEPGKNHLRQLANDWDIDVLDHDPKVGGRFSAFTNVGLLPAALAGLDIWQIRKGAKEVAENESIIGAALNVCMMEKGININVIMPYVDRLSSLADLYCQIWSESLGKDGFGSTPVKAMGAVDQHSQLQLYLAGPEDKFFTLIMLNQKNKGKRINSSLIKNKELSYIKDKTVGDIMQAEQEATYKTLLRHKLPVRTIMLEKLDEKVLGALLMHFYVETMLTGLILNINPFDQPAVEEGKVIARSILGKM